MNVSGAEIAERNERWRAVRRMAQTRVGGAWISDTGYPWSVLKEVNPDFYESERRTNPDHPEFEAWRECAHCGEGWFFKVGCIRCADEAFRADLEHERKMRSGYDITRETSE